MDDESIQMTRTRRWAEAAVLRRLQASRGPGGSLSGRNIAANRRHGVELALATKVPAQPSLFESAPGRATDSSPRLTLLHAAGQTRPSDATDALRGHGAHKNP